MNGPCLRALSVALACASFACHEKHEEPAHARDSGPAVSERVEPPDSPPASSEHAEPAAKPRFVHGRVPVAAFVAEELAKAPANGVTLVYAGATWCEPCQRFHRALEAGELDAELSGVRFIDYDLDVAGEALIADGYRSKLIPLFALPKSDGSASGRQIEGSVKGDGAVQNILPRLLELTGRRAPAAR